MTIDINPLNRPVWGERGYTVQPSHVLPSMLSAMLVVNVALLYNKYKYSSFNMFVNPLTFDCLELYELIFMSKMIKKQVEKKEPFYTTLFNGFWKMGRYDICDDTIERLLEHYQKIRKENKGEITHA